MISPPDHEDLSEKVPGIFMVSDTEVGLGNARSERQVEFQMSIESKNIHHPYDT